MNVEFKDNNVCASMNRDCTPRVLHVSELEKLIIDMGCAEQWKTSWDIYGQKTNPLNVFKNISRVVFFRHLVKTANDKMRESYTVSAVVSASTKDRHYAFNAANFEVVRVPWRGKMRPARLGQIPLKAGEVVMIPFVSAVKGLSGVTVLRARITGGGSAPGVR